MEQPRRAALPRHASDGVRSSQSVAAELCCRGERQVSSGCGERDVAATLSRFFQQFSALTDVLFRFLTEPKEVERFLTQLSEFAAMNKISLGPLKNIVKSLLLVPNGALKRNLSSEQVRADFIALGLSEEKASYFAEQWKLNSPTLTSLAVGQTLMINQLIDMEWKFGVTAGNSELEKVGSIFLQLKLVVKKGNQTEPVYVELTLPQFYSFLHEMERVKTSLECFS
ncbi:PREDICTED: COMM domain-containing protein 7 [Crocodylus porosus]|uniref:COMM domain-containing protein 7 n=1 Tax=Crocodylus porosus TaxID=8502 RepID=UPI00093CC4F7|nr:PREDICTED: COMM domain-containing protein 7 [Crocodylus porosus]